MQDIKGLCSGLDAPLHILRPRRVWCLPTTHIGDSPDITTSTDAPVFQSQLHSNRVTPDNTLKIQSKCFKIASRPLGLLANKSQNRKKK